MYTHHLKCVKLCKITKFTCVLFVALGFHEGMADIVSLSFQTPEHMKVIGLLDEVPQDSGKESHVYLLSSVSLFKKQTI